MIAPACGDPVPYGARVIGVGYERLAGGAAAAISSSTVGRILAQDERKPHRVTF